MKTRSPKLSPFEFLNSVTLDKMLLKIILLLLYNFVDSNPETRCAKNQGAAKKIELGIVSTEIVETNISIALGSFFASHYYS